MTRTSLIAAGLLVMAGTAAQADTRFYGTGVVSSVTAACNATMIIGQHVNMKFRPAGVGGNDANTVIDIFSDNLSAGLFLAGKSLTTTPQTVSGTIIVYKPLTFTASVSAKPAPAPKATDDFVTFNATISNFGLPGCTVGMRVALARN